MVDVIMDSGLPVESYVNQDNQQAYWSPVESLIVKELWSHQVESFGMFQEGVLSTIVIYHQNKAIMVFFELCKV